MQAIGCSVQIWLVWLHVSQVLELSSLAGNRTESYDGNVRRWNVPRSADVLSLARLPPNVPQCHQRVIIENAQQPSCQLRGANKR